MGRTALFHAAMGTKTGMIELLAAYGGDPNIRDKEGRTALMTASSLCRYWNIKALLEHGADPSIRNNRGRTALEPDYVATNDPNCAISRRLLQEAVSRLH